MDGVILSGDQYAATGSLDEKPRYEKEAVFFRDVMEDYLKNAPVLDYLKKEGKNPPPRTYGSLGLDDHAIAAYVEFKQGGKKDSMIVSNGSGKGFVARVNDFAGNYGIPASFAKDYVLTHEIMHAAGYKDEAETEKATGRYFREMAEKDPDNSKYKVLSNVADIRAKEASGKATYRNLSQAYKI